MIVNRNDPKTIPGVEVVCYHHTDENEAPMINLAYAFPTAPSRLLALEIYQPCTPELTNLATVDPAALHVPGSPKKSKMLPLSPTKQSMGRKSSKLSWKAPVRPLGENIPIFDGPQPFKEKYQSLPKINQELEEYSAVAATFTVSSYTAEATGMRTLSLNVQDVILLADVDHAEPDGPPTQSQPLWVAQDEKNDERVHDVEESSSESDSAGDFI
ncbi:hypothetical protein C0993_006984 [Termitomyces sp. T159_Od127]|nr:hypothetical protein C0993_006984 [Termitomyces sp. T159_Od127]